MSTLSTSACFLAASAVAFHLMTRFFCSSSFLVSSSRTAVRPASAFLAASLAFFSWAVERSWRAWSSLAFAWTAASMPSPARSAASWEASMATEVSLTTAVHSTRIAREAKSRADCVSLEDSSAGLQHTRREVLQLPPTESSRMRVSLESRKGTCFFLSASAWTTLPNASSEALMFAASFRPCPWTPDRFTRSLPARSTTVSLPTVACIFTGRPLFSVALGRLVILIWKIECERLDALFILVSA
mmetsp:Transcript_31874/g.53560  ORF Transcript_31874/g.53560 Transcript_31874/m.53560 type:complete len:244 (+) Transcript_31874:1386-2117(+)